MINATTNDPTKSNNADEPMKVGANLGMSEKNLQNPAVVDTPAKPPVFNATIPTIPMSSTTSDSDLPEKKPVLNSPVVPNKTEPIPTFVEPTPDHKPELVDTPPGSDQESDQNPKKSKSKNKFNVKMIAGVFALLLIIVGASAGFFLSQQSQDLRQQAAFEDNSTDNPYFDPGDNPELKDIDCNLPENSDACLTLDILCPPNHTLVEGTLCYPNDGNSICPVGQVYCLNDECQPFGAGDAPNPCLPNIDPEVTVCTTVYEPGPCVDGCKITRTEQKCCDKNTGLNCKWYWTNDDLDCNASCGGNTPTPTPPSLTCNSTCTTDTQCSNINPDWSCETAEGSTDKKCRLTTNPASTTCEPSIPGEPMCKDVAVLENNLEIDPATAPLSIGTVLQFRCSADDPNTQITNYEFKITEPDGTIIEGAAINPAGSSATSLEYQIDQYLEHLVQCRVCTTDGCQDWITVTQ
jgi:hypothetical protein